MSHDRDRNGAEHAIDHTGHEDMFRHRSWICLALTFPVLSGVPPAVGDLVMSVSTIGVAINAQLLRTFGLED
jgi:hypothetical protein